MITLTTALLLVSAAAAETPDLADPLRWRREKIGEGIYEAAGAFDVNNDGKIDIVSGEYWHEGPDFKKSHQFCELQRVDDYYDDFSAYPMDVNGDGYLDVVSGGWWGMTMQWRENPQGKPGMWKTHDVARVGNVERNCFYDLDGDGRMEVFSTTGPLNFFRLKVDAAGKGTGDFDRFMIRHGENGMGPGGHGFGCGDLNGDGRPDFLFATGWFEGPEDPFNVKGYTWHGEWNFGSASVPLLVHDVDKDGLADVIVGQAHDYGLAWYAQGKGDDGARTWTKHDIETARSQFHEMQLADIDNDGELELVTGKRYRAHAFADPGSLDPLGLYYYEINGGNFQRVTIDYGPAGQASGTGIYLAIEDVDGDGWKDIVAPGKEGMYLFRNLGPARGDEKK